MMAAPPIYNKEGPTRPAPKSCKCGRDGLTCAQYREYPGGACRRCYHAKPCHRRQEK